MNKKVMIDKFADLLLNHSLGGITKRDVVMIKGEAIAWPLIAALQVKILKAGGLPDIFLIPPDNERGRVWSATVAKHAAPERLYMPESHLLRYKEFTKYIEILGMENPELVAKVMTPAMDKIMQLNATAAAIRGSKPWVITAMPTSAMARIEGMNYAKYEKLVYKSVTQDIKPLTKKADKMAALLQKTRVLKIITKEPGSAKLYKLKMDLSKSVILKDTKGPPASSLPCGEIYTSPDSNSVEGEIFLDLPFSTQGDVLQGVYMRFKRGKVVNYNAKAGQRFLKSILDTDDGAKRIGEVAFGFNPQLTKPMLDPLFCEKLAGTMHLALGTGFPAAHVTNLSNKAGQMKYKTLVKTGVANVSAQHVDLVVSFRHGGAGQAVYLDNTRLNVRNGNWDTK